MKFIAPKQWLVSNQHNSVLLGFTRPPHLSKPDERAREEGGSASPTQGAAWRLALTHPVRTPASTGSLTSLPGRSRVPECSGGRAQPWASGAVLCLRRPRRLGSQGRACASAPGPPVPLAASSGEFSLDSGRATP